MVTVPSLRFKEFTEEWKKYLLRNIVEKVNCKNVENSISLVFSNSAVHGIVLQNDYFDKEIANKENLNGYYIVQPLDFVYNPRLSSNAQVGAMSVNHTNQIGLVSPLYTVFRKMDSKIYTSFLEYLFKSTVWHNYMRNIANYGARDDRMNIKSGDFFAMPLTFPAMKEQEKIASLLSFIDDRITTQNKIIERYESLIGGLRNLMISEIDSHCVKNTILSFCDIQSGYTGTQLDSTTEGCKVTRIETISHGYIDLSKVGHVEKKANIQSYKLKVEDILFSNINSVSHIGKTAFIDNDYDLYHGMNLLKLRVISKDILPYFLYLLLNTDKFRSKFQSICNQAVSQASINQTELGKVIIPCPNIELQTKYTILFKILNQKLSCESNIVTSKK